MRLVALRTLGRVAAKGDDVTDPGLGIAVGDLERFFPAGIDAGQVRGDVQAGVLDDGFDRLVGQLARGAAGAVGDRDELGLGVLQGADRIPEPERGFDRAGREEFVGNRGGHVCLRGGRILSHVRICETNS